MPTPIVIDGFEHQYSTINDLAGTTEGLWSFVEGSAPTFPAGRNGVCMQLAPAAAALRLQKRINDPTICVVSFYFKTSTAPSGIVNLFLLETIGFSAAPKIQLNPNGTIRAQVAATTVDTSSAYNDGNWHRIDIRANVGGNPWLVDWQVDGSNQTGFSSADTATGIRTIQFGTDAAHTFTCQYDDFVASATSADYPLGAHDVLYGVPTGDGTHNAGVNTIEDQAGTDIVSPNAFPLLDELPPTTTDYIQQSTIGTGNYAEVTFDDQPGSKTIWGVEGVGFLFASGLNANNGTTRIVDGSNNTLTDIYSGDQSETALHNRRAIITAPGGGWDSGYPGVKARVGFSSDVTDVPRWAGLLLQYAVVPGPPPGGAATLDPFGMSGFFGA